jgi:hypothetical protein
MSNDDINQQIFKNLELDENLAISYLILNRLKKIRSEKYPPSDTLEWVSDRLPQRLTGGGLCTSEMLWSCLNFLSKSGYIQILNRKKIRILRSET